MKLTLNVGRDLCRVLSLIPLNPSIRSASVGLAEFENPRVRTLANPLFAKQPSAMLIWPSVAAEPLKSRDLVSMRNLDRSLCPEATLYDSVDKYNLIYLEIF